MYFNKKIFDVYFLRKKKKLDNNKLVVDKNKYTVYKHTPSHNPENKNESLIKDFNCVSKKLYDKNEVKTTVMYKELVHLKEKVDKLISLRREF